MSVRSPAQPADPPLDERGSSADRADWQPGELGVAWTLWLVYGAFYFCRTNLSAAVPGMKLSAEAGGLGFTSEQTGWILASGKVAYGIGQLLNGQLAERFSPRKMLAVGMFERQHELIGPAHGALDGPIVTAPTSIQVITPFNVPPEAAG